MHPGVTVENSKSQKDELIVQVDFNLPLKNIEYKKKALNTKMSSKTALMY